LRPGRSGPSTAITRRAFGGLAAAAVLAPQAARAAPPVPLVIAEGGAGADRPEDSRSAFDLAIDQGADFLQATLVPTKDGALIVRRDNELSATTDVASHPEFGDRRTAKTIDGVPVTGWFSEDFTLAEIRTLTCVTRLPAYHPQSVKYDRKEPVLTLDELLALARAGCVRSARTIGVMPRMLHVGYYAAQDIAIDQKLADVLNTGGYSSKAAAIWAQAFEAAALISFSRLCRVRLMQLIDASPVYQRMLNVAGLAQVRAYAEAIGPDQSLVIDPTAAIFPAPTTLTLDARAAGLVVHSRTARGENAFLPRALQRGNPNSPNFPGGRGDLDRLMVGLYANGVDGLATDQPGRAVRARQTAIDQLAQGRR